MKNTALPNLSVIKRPTLWVCFLFFLLIYLPGSAQTTESFSTAGSFQWAVPCGVSSISVQAWGSGAGGKSTILDPNGGGGGGGAFASVSNFAVTTGTVYTVIVGAGGLTAGASADGQFSRFRLLNTNIVAAEGAGLGTGNNTEGGRASACIGTIKYSGGDGGAHILFSSGAGGGGSAGSLGVGGIGGVGTIFGAGVGGAAGAGGGAVGGKGGYGTIANAVNGNNPGAGGGEKSTVLGLHGLGANGLVKISYNVQPLTVSYTPAKTFCANVPITPIAATIVNGTVTNFSVTPALPAGLSIHATTGVISGTATASSAATIYTIKAVNACYTVNATQSIAITAASEAGNWSAPLISICYNSSGNLLSALSGQVGNLQWQTAASASGSWTNAASGAYTNLVTEKYYRLIAQNSSCKKDTSDVVKLGIKNMWVGNTSSDWLNQTNWSDGNLPTLNGCNTIRISDGANDPVIQDTNIVMVDLIILSGAGLTVNDSGGIKVEGNISTPAHAINLQHGTLELFGSGNSSFSGRWFVGNSLKNLLVSRNLNIPTTPADSLVILGTLSFQNNANAALYTGDNIILKSSFTGTANVATLDPGNVIVGKMTVERYISVGSLPGHHGKSWQFLAAPVTGITIRNAWQEGGLITSTPNGYGAWLSGPGGTANGYDVESALPGLKTFAPGPGEGSWANIANTNTAINNAQGYMIFIRGDRSVINFSGLNSAPQPTVLRAKGEIIRGPQTGLLIPAGQFQSIANPYPSAIDLSTLNLVGGAQSSFVFWDPWLAGLYNLGAYQTITIVNGKYVATPGFRNRFPGDTIRNEGIEDDRFVQSGQAFFMSAVGSNGRVYFNESNKVNSSSTATREPNQEEAEPQSVLGTYLLAHSGASRILADGNQVVFDDSHSNAVDIEDAVKLQNAGENFGLLRNGKSLAVEYRGAASAADTIFYRIKNMSNATYTMKFAPVYFTDHTLIAEFVDQFTGNRSPVSLMDTGYVQVQFTSNPASKAADRFMLVFKTAIILPVRFIAVTAAAAPNGRNTILWKVAAQENITGYVLERSMDGIQFQDLMQLAVQTGNASGAAQYQQWDNHPQSGTNYYRIRAISQDGQIQYSRIVSVGGEDQDTKISVFPNPVQDKNISIVFRNLSGEKIALSLWNLSGQMVYQEKILLQTGAEQRQTIQLPNSTPAGMYKLRWKTLKGKLGIVEVIIE